MPVPVQKITTLEMECAVAQFLGVRRNLIVPNVNWGMNLHECDLLVATQAGYLWEVEIKVSRADLKKDAEKRHGHRSHRIKHLYFAIPKYLEHCIEFIPEHAGILVVERYEGNEWRDAGVRARQIRKPATNHCAPISANERYQLARLGALRIWDLKRKLARKPETSKISELEG